MTLEDPLAPAPDVPLATGVDGARFRYVLGHFATGVAVVTVFAGGRPGGLSVNSFTSVSLDPPLVGFCVAPASSTWARIRETGTFCVNVLSAGQEEMCRVFAAKMEDKFAGVEWRPAPSGSPILAGVLAWIDCTVHAHYEAGDHHIVVGQVRDLAVVDGGMPLVFYRGGYGQFGP